MKCQQRELECEAIQWTGENLSEIIPFLGDELIAKYGAIIEIGSYLNEATVNTGDWIFTFDGKSFETLSNNVFKERFRFLPKEIEG